MYDLDGNGYIDKDEMTQIAEAYYKLVGNSLSSKWSSPAELVEEVNIFFLFHLC